MIIKLATVVVPCPRQHMRDWVALDAISQWEEGLMKSLLTILIVLTMAGAASAEVVDYGWEDAGDVLGIYPDPDLPSIYATNVADYDGEPVHGGNFSLKLVDNAESGTPQAYVAFLWNLQDGDMVTVGFWRYDDTPSGSPRCASGVTGTTRFPTIPTATTARPAETATTAPAPAGTTPSTPGPWSTATPAW